MSLSDAHVGPIIPVVDEDRARDFYENTLGLAGEPTPGGYKLTAGSGTRVYLLPVGQGAGTANWPLASFEVEHIDAVVTRLREAGAVQMTATETGFELDDLGVARQDDLAVAWYRDPDGNGFTVFQRL